MNRREEKTFTRILNRMLMKHGLHLQGIRLKCRRCGEVAFARDPTIAEQFGWSELRHGKGPNYRGLCVECRGKKQSELH